MKFSSSTRFIYKIYPLPFLDIVHVIPFKFLIFVRQAREIDGKGRGVIATRDFAKGQFVVEYYGDLIDVTKAKELEAKYGMDPSIGCYMYYFEFKNKRYW